MSLNGLRIGGQCPSGPLTVRDKVILCTIGFVLGAPILYALVWIIGETVEHFTP